MRLFSHGRRNRVAGLRGATVIGVSAIALMLMADVAGAKSFGPWAPPQKIDEVGGNSSELNTSSVDGCPIQAPDGLSLYLASTRPGGLGGIDIWVSHRASAADPWGAPENLGEP